MEKLGIALVAICIFIVLFGVISLLCAFPTLWLWNWLMPAIFGLKTITFWQAFGMNFLTSILFKSYNYNNNSN